MALKRNNDHPADCPCGSEQRKYIRSVLKDSSNEELLHDQRHRDLSTAHVRDEEHARRIGSLAKSAAKHNFAIMKTNLLVDTLFAVRQVRQLLAGYLPPLHRDSQRLAETKQLLIVSRVPLV